MGQLAPVDAEVPRVHKAHVHDWESAAQPAPLGHATVTHIGSERPWERRQ